MKIPFPRALVAALFCLSFSAAVVAAQSPDEVWQDVRETDIARGNQDRQIVPEKYRAFTLNRGRLESLLARAPREGVQRAAGSTATLRLPLPDGTYGNFRIVDSPVMEDALAAKFPQIKTYLGQGVEDPTMSARFDVTPKGFHAQIIGKDGTYYVDPFQPGDIDHYIAYRKHDHKRTTRDVCLVTGEPIGSAEDTAKHLGAKVSSGATLRTYRLAMAATGEYTAFHGGTVLDGLSGIVSTVNRVNGIYEREVSVRMVLVANNDLIIFTNAGTDPYANTSGDLAANQTTINGAIGSANYDIGHLVGTGGGGVAGLGVVCGTSKARGLTGSGAPVADGYDVDYVAHEMGHQFSGNHTFNGGGTPASAGNNCSGGNRSGSTAYEPGSGVTIQAYAGICANDDLQPNSEDYFHRVSLNEILAFTTNAATGASCGTTSPTGNAIPTVTAAAPTFTIPGRTPFTLTATGLDTDGDPLTYVWEEFDLPTAANAEGVLDATVATGPLFRGYAPSSDPSRTFPSWRYILDNANVVPPTAPRPGTTGPSWMSGEVLPNASRTMNFRVTVRDNKAGGGGTNEANTAIVVSNTAGPFAVTAPNSALTWAAGSLQPVTWNVAGTDGAPIATANVRITLSTDGGNTWPIVLLASTANDGSENVTVPAGLATTQARVRVEAVGNVYFDVSNTNFTITSAGNQPPGITVTGPVAARQGAPTASAAVATVSDAEDVAGTLLVGVSGAPPELTVNVQNAGGVVTLSATADCTLVAPTADTKAYPVQVTVTDSAGATRSAEVVINVSGNRTPTLGTYRNVAVIRNETRIATPTAPGADADGNLAGGSVTPTTLTGGGTVSVAADGTVTIVTTPTTTLGTYNIKPRVADSCGAVETRGFDVVVGNPQVVLAIDSSQVTSGNGLFEPNECNTLDVTVRNDGNIPATGVSAVLSTSTPNVTIAQASSAYANIPSGGSTSNTTAFQVTSSNALTCFSNLDLTLTVSYAEPGAPFAGSVTALVGSQPENYVFTSSSGATLPNDGVLVAGSNGSDTSSEPIVSLTTPFAFSIYGTNYGAGTGLRASTNGNLQVRPNQGAPDFGNAALPTLGSGGNANTRFPAADPTLFLQWDDWRMDVAGGGAGTGAGIYTKVEGVAPNRSWIIEWRGRIRGDGAATTNSNRAAIVFHEGSNSFDYIYLLTGTGASSNGAGSTIGVQKGPTAFPSTFTQFALDNAFLAPGTKLTAAVPPPVCAAGFGTCGTPAVALVETGSSTTLVEGGATDTYSIVLVNPPTANVTITTAPDAQVGTAPPSLTFTPSNWSNPQPVTVNAVNDFVAEGTHSGTITHAATGGNYAGVSIPNVVASITDNDTLGAILVESGGSTAVTEGGATDTYTLRLNSQPTAAVTVSINPGSQLTTVPSGSVTFDASDWQTPKTITVSAVDDAVFEQAHTGTITHIASGGGYDAVSVANVSVNITDNEIRVADLAITDALTNAPIGPGQRLIYAVDIENLTAGADVGAAQFTFTLSPVLTSVSWTCVADAGSTCPASGSGAPSHSITLAGGTGVSYLIGATVPAGTAMGTPLMTTATVSVTTPYQDNLGANNTASTNHTVGLDLVFKDGFE